MENASIPAVHSDLENTVKGLAQITVNISHPIKRLVMKSLQCVSMVVKMGFMVTTVIRHALLTAKTVSVIGFLGYAKTAYQNSMDHSATFHVL